MDLTVEERRKLTQQLRYNANRFRLPALPNVWPEWMTPEKRQSMADNFEDCANYLDGRDTESGLRPKDPAQVPGRDPRPSE